MAFRRVLAALVVTLTAGCAGSSAVPTDAPSSLEEQAPPEEPPPVFALAAEVADAADDENAVQSKITAVTVYSDRALVTRKATVTVGAEATVHRFHHLPGWVDDGSVRAATSVGKIVDVTVERRFLARSSDQGFRTMEERHEALLRRRQALDDEIMVLEQRRQHIESIKVYSLEKLSTDAVTRDVNVKEYGDVVDFVSESLREVAQARRKAEAQRVALGPEIEASDRKLDELRRLTTLEETTVSVTIEGKRAGAADLTLHYLTPGATWEPQHELRTEKDEPGKVAVTSYAVVTNTTGEDWRNATLSFSTSSSSDPERIPELTMLALGDTQRVERSTTRTRTASFSRAQQAYQEQNLHWNRMNQAPSRKRSEVERFEKSYTSNLEFFEQVQNRTVEIFQGLEQRGTNVHFEARFPAIVRSDGRPIRLPIGTRSIDAERKIVAAPEESLNAALTLEMRNTSGQPLLPGRVARYRDGSFLGMTDVDFVAKGEEFSLFFSVADEVKLSRELDRKRSSLVRTTRNRMQLSFVTKAKNLSDRPVELVLAERVPVSENSAITVSNVVIQPSEKPDARGIIRWKLKLRPGEERELRTSYRVDYPSSLILDVKRKRERRKSMPSPAPDKYDVEDQVYDLEQML